jgi:hypothetical protein
LSNSIIGLAILENPLMTSVVSYQTKKASDV